MGDLHAFVLRRDQMVEKQICPEEYIGEGVE